MQHVQIEVHKGMATVLKLGPGIEVEVVDVDAKEIVVYTSAGNDISAHVLSDAEVQAHQ